MVRIGLIAALLALGLVAASPTQAKAQTPPPEQQVYGPPPPAQTPGQTPVQGTPTRGRGWGKWWKRAKCAAAITWVVGTTVFAAGKITKIKGAIKALGGIKNTAKLLVGATSRAEKMRKLGQAGAAAASYFLGIDTIKKNC